LAQALIPLAGCGVFLGLSALTVNLLKGQGVPVFWANNARLALLVGANLWTLTLAWGITGRYTPALGRRVLAWGAVLLALVPVNTAWAFMFWLW